MNKPAIIITVQDGVVQDVYSDTPDVVVVLVDYDGPMNGDDLLGIVAADGTVEEGIEAIKSGDLQGEVEDHKVIERILESLKTDGDKPAAVEEDYIRLKFGDYKGSYTPNSPEAGALLDTMNDLLDDDKANERKQVLCKAIDLLNGKVYGWWQDRELTKEEAKKYILEYKSTDSNE